MPISRVNFVLNLKKSYSDPIGELFDESLAERNLEKMFDTDYLGSSFYDNSSVSDYDKAKIKEFENSIHNRKNVYIAVSEKVNCLALYFFKAHK